MDCVFLAKEGTTSPILNHARHHGAHVFVTSSEGYRGFAEHLTRSGEWFPVGLFMPWVISNPFGVEGYKTFAYEMIEDLGRTPEAVLFPCARGNGLYGAWKGFSDAFHWGWTDHKPRMVSCQPLVANSLAVSVDQDTELPVEIPPARSVAVSTCETVSSPHALDAIRVSQGAALSASENDILAAVDALAAEGLCVEAASALPVACLRALVEVGEIDPAAPIVCVLTAAGIKWPQDLSENGPPIVEIDDDPDTLDRCLAEAGL
jgi:threonine synthase